MCYCLIYYDPRYKMSSKFKDFDKNYCVSYNENLNNIFFTSSKSFIVPLNDYLIKKGCPFLKNQIMFKTKVGTALGKTYEDYMIFNFKEPLAKKGQQLLF